MTEKEDYVLGYGDSAMDWMTSRNVEVHGAFVLPYLKAGLSLIDCGCGPASLTVGFAERLKPGRVVGIDREAAQFKTAERYGAERDLDNLTLSTGDVYALPYEDASFDIAFCSAVLGSVGEPERVIAEMVRVVKPGGVIAAKEFDHGSDMVYPQNETLAKSIELYQRARASFGHEPRGGRRLREWLSAAGCELVHTHAFFDQRTMHTGLYEYIDRNNRLVAEVLAAQYYESGWATPQEVDEQAAEWERFAQEPASIYAAAWVEAIGRKPI